MVKSRLILLFLLFPLSYCVAQQNNSWYFGRYAGLNFNGPVPVPDHNSAMSADEGCASICDSLGNILFYTNGLTVYNKNHQVMLNGSALNGNISAVQSSLIVPIPGNPFIFYLFTTDAVENSFASGYNYSIIDMRRDNGLGEVVNKNILLSSSCTERLAAARHSNGLSVWVITNDRNSNKFNSWLVDCNGISSSPVVSTSGTVMNMHILSNTGMMKVSPDGKQLCQTHFPIFDDVSLTPNFFQLFDFNNQTGVVSNGRTIDPGDSRITSCEFSPNSKLLYISRAYDKKIDQYEATLSTSAQILTSRITINTTPEAYYGIQVGPDRKIYLSSVSEWVGAIAYPDIKGTGSNYIKEAIKVNGRNGGFADHGFPNFINDLSFDGSNRIEYQILDSCTGQIQFNGISTMPGTITWSWDFGDGTFSTLQNPVHSFSSGTLEYTVKLKIYAIDGCSAIERTVKIIPRGLLIDPNFDFTGVCDSGFIRFKNTSLITPETAWYQTIWDFGDGNMSTLNDPVHSYAPGNYTVRLTIKTTTACLDQTITRPVIMEVMDIQTPPDFEINAGEAVQLNVTGGGTRFLWSPPAGLSSTTIANPVAKPSMSTMYVVTAYNDAGCTDKDSIFVKLKPVPGIYVPTGFTPNNDGKNDVFKPSIADNYVLHAFSVYNRWGQKIFSTSQKETGWNGKVHGILQNPGVYVWVVIATETQSGKKEERKGTFVILR